MNFIWDKITEWLKGLLVGGIVAATAEQLDGVGLDFGDIALLAVLVVPATAADLAFHIDLAAFADIIFRQVGQLPPGDDGVPFGHFPRFTASVFVSFAGGQRNGGDGGAALQMSDFRILPYISDEYNFIDRHIDENFC